MIPASRTIAALCLLVALGALAGAAESESFRFPAIAVALLALLVGATAIGRANHSAQLLRDFVRGPVAARLWGQPPPIADDGVFVVERVFAISAGLHVWLRRASGGDVHRIKIAQPGQLIVEGSRAEIRHAKYVSLDGRKITPDRGAPAIVLEREQAGPA